MTRAAACAFLLLCVGCQHSAPTPQAKQATAPPPPPPRAAAPAPPAPGIESLLDGPTRVELVPSVTGAPVGR
jgi:hypothetical protein